MSFNFCGVTIGIKFVLSNISVYGFTLKNILNTRF
jgi:hypothetical protein